MSNEREALVEPWKALHKRLLRLGAAIIMERRHGEPLKRPDAEKQDNRLCDLAVESRHIADALAAAARAALSQPNHPETPDGSPAVGTIKQIDTPPGRPDLHEWTGHEWAPVGYSMARVGSAVGAALLDAQPAQGADAGWKRTATRRPVAGQLIVKRWARTGAVWAGVYSGTEKDSAFDEWFALPAAAATPEGT